MSLAKFRIGLIQMACSQDPNENMAKAEWRIREAAGKGAQIVCLQELFRSQYFCREENAAMFDLAEPVPGPTTESLARLARELAIVVIGSVFERRAAGVYHNTAVVIDADGSLAGAYRKMHIPDDPLYYEKFYFTPGDLGFRCFDTRYARVAPLVCWDQWYPEAARLAALGGAQVIFYPTAIGRRVSEKAAQGAAEHDAWRTIQRAHAIANGVYVAAVNRVGCEGPPEQGLEFWGDRSWPTRSARCWRRPRTIARKPSLWSATPAALKTCAATGRSCATAESTPTAPILNRVID